MGGADDDDIEDDEDDVVESADKGRPFSLSSQLFIYLRVAVPGFSSRFTQSWGS
jgi:hypothetical protein